MTWRGLAPYRGGIRVIHYWKDGVRVDVKGTRGFDMKSSRFSDDAALGEAIKEAGLSVSVQQVRAAA